MPRNFPQLVPRGGTITPRELKLGRGGVSVQLTTIVAWVALLSLVATTAFGTLGAALFVLASAALIVLAPQDAAGGLLRFWPLLLLPLLALVSTTWSDSPERTIRAGLQLLITCVAAIVIAREIGARAIILNLFIGSLGICLMLMPAISIALARHTPLFSDLLGSKNQAGFAAQMLIALSLAVVVDSNQPIFARLLTLPAVGLAFVIVVLAQSAGASTSIAITLITFPAFMVFGRVNMSLRIVILLLVVLLAVVALIFLPDLQAAWADFRVSVLKKDATLTGRTYLWDFAARLNAERPWFGRGYYAFWRQGNIDAEGLWRWGGIATRSGFNFHNAYIEMQVDLGWAGLGLFIATCVVVGVAGFVAQLMRPSAPTAFLLSMLIVLYLRSYAESGLIAPFSLLTVLWIATMVNAVNDKRSGKAAKMETGLKLSAATRVHTPLARSPGRKPRRL